MRQCRCRNTRPAVTVDRLVKLYKAVAAVDGISFRSAARHDHRAARRQRRRQDHDNRDDHGPGHADLRHGLGARRANAAPALSRAAPDEFREPLCGAADAAHGAAKPLGVRPALRGRRYRRAHRRSCRRSRSRSTSSTGRPANCRPGRRPASRSPRRCSTARKSCCSTSRPRRSIPIPPTGCAARLDHYRAAHGATMLLASHNMTEVERLCERVIIMKQGRIEDDDTPHACSPAMDARRWKRCSSTWRAAAGARPRNDRPRASSCPSAASRSASNTAFRGAASPPWCALLVSAALVLAARARPDLLADRADADVGLPAALCDAERRAVSRAAGGISSARCCCGISCSAASSAFRFRFSRRCGRTISPT